MLNKKVFSEGFAGMCEMFGKEPSPALLKLYYEVLKQLTGEQFKSACVHIVSTHKYNSLPKPAEFLEFVHGVPEDRALLELQTVEKAMREVGAHESYALCKSEHYRPELRDAAIRLEEDGREQGHRRRAAGSVYRRRWLRSPLRYVHRLQEYS